MFRVSCDRIRHHEFRVSPRTSTLKESIPCRQVKLDAIIRDITETVYIGSLLLTKWKVGYRKSSNKRRVSIRRRVSDKRRVPNNRRVTGGYDGCGNLLI